MLKKILIISGYVVGVCLIISQVYLISKILQISGKEELETPTRAITKYEKRAADESRLKFNKEIAIANPETALAIGTAILQGLISTDGFSFRVTDEYGVVRNDEFGNTIRGDNQEVWYIFASPPRAEGVGSVGDMYRIEIRKSDGKVMCILMG